MSLQRVLTVVRKEVREFRRNRFVIGTMAVLPLVFLITPSRSGSPMPSTSSPRSASASVPRMS